MTDKEKERAIARSDLVADAIEATRELLLSKGLYHRVDTSTELGKLVEQRLRDADTFSFDVHCVGCQRESTFRISTPIIATRSIGGRQPSRVILPTLFAVQAVCQRSWHVYTYVFQGQKDAIVKIGQSPSLADISIAELRPIDKSLEQRDRRELARALGLFAHDTALGAFVYLRRVFERMIERAHERQRGLGRPIEGFADMPMDRRISALKEELPPRVVRNSAVFSVLSLGLHELTEEQCAEYFPVLKAVIFQMLEQEEHKRRATVAEQETDNALQRILAKSKGA